MGGTRGSEIEGEIPYRDLRFDDSDEGIKPTTALPTVAFLGRNLGPDPGT